MTYGLTEDALITNSERRFFTSFCSLINVTMSLYDFLYWGFRWPWYIYLYPLISFGFFYYNVGQRMGIQNLINRRERRL